MVGLTALIPTRLGRGASGAKPRWPDRILQDRPSARAQSRGTIRRDRTEQRQRTGRPHGGNLAGWE